MLVWKTQTLNVTMASLRYRCLLPLRYLSQQGISSTICAGGEPPELTPHTQALIFVKSFRDEDVATCEQAYQLGVPVILDLCDNIFIDEYAADNDYVPANNFRLMAQRAAAIVTTGEAMKAEVERAIFCEKRPEKGSGKEGEKGGAIAPPNSAVPVVVIPDGNETLEDIKFAFRSTRWRRLSSLIQQRVIKKVLRSTSRTYGTLKQRVSKRAYKQGKRQLKVIVFKIKGKTGQKLRRCGLLAPSKNSPQPTASATFSTNHFSSQSPAPEACAPDFLSPDSLFPNHVEAKKTVKSKATQPTPWRPLPWIEAAAGVKTVLWFGNHGAQYGNFGMSNILDVAAALETVGHEQPLRLMVVSNSREKYDRCIAPLPFATNYLPWHPRKIYDYIRASDVVIVPNSQSKYSICKSANRTVLALSQETPVIASCTPALNMFAGCVWPVMQPEDWAQGLRAYLLRPEVSHMHVAQAQRVIAQHLSGEIIAQQWLSLVQAVSTSATAAAKSHSRLEARTEEDRTELEEMA